MDVRKEARRYPDSPLGKAESKAEGVGKLAKKAIRSGKSIRIYYTILSHPSWVNSWS
jgi:hypothetical protein